MWSAWPNCLSLSMMDLFLDNWTTIALALLVAMDVIVSLTPSQADDKLVGYLKLLVQAIHQDNKKKK